MKTTLAAAFLALLVTSAGAYDLHVKALTPVREEPAASHPPLRLVRDGRLDFALDADWSGSTRSRFYRAEALEILTQACARVFGAVPRTGDARTAGPERYRLRLVDTGRDQAFTIASDADGVTISGHVEYGIIDFCERILGVRWYFPGEHGSDYPPLRELTVAPLRYSDAPYFDRRDPIRYYLYGSLGWSGQLKHYEPYLGTVPKNDHFIPVRWRCGGTLPIAGQHCPEPRALAKAYPDKLDVIFHRSPNGRLWYDPDKHIGNYFNVWNLEFADLLVDAWRKFYETKGRFNPGFAGGVNDTAISFGVCDTGISAAETNGIENVYGRFFDCLSKKAYAAFPDKRLYLMCYADCASPPTDGRCRMPPNVELNLCVGYLPSKVTVPAQVERIRRRFRGWSETIGGRPVARVWLYAPGHNKFGRAVVPEFVGLLPKTFGDLLGREELFYDYWGGEDIWHYYYAPYVMYKSMWNPEFDVDAALDELFTRMYPRAAKEMKAFHALLREAHVRVGAPAAGYEAKYPLKVVNELERLLSAAEGRIAPGSVEMRRFRLIADYWKEPFAKQRGKVSAAVPICDALHAEGPVDWTKAAAVAFIDRTDGTPVAEDPPDVRFAWNGTSLLGRAPADWTVTVHLAEKEDAAPKAFSFRDGKLEVPFAEVMSRKPYFHAGLLLNVVAKRDAHVFGNALTMGEDANVKAYGVLRLGGRPLELEKPAERKGTSGFSAGLTVTKDDPCGDRKAKLVLDNGGVKYEIAFNQYPKGHGASPRFVFGASRVEPLGPKPTAAKIVEFGVNRASSLYLDFPADDNVRYETDGEIGWDFRFCGDDADVTLRLYLRKGCDVLFYDVFSSDSTAETFVRFKPSAAAADVWTRRRGSVIQGGIR